MKDPKPHTESQPVSIRYLFLALFLVSGFWLLYWYCIVIATPVPTTPGADSAAIWARRGQFGDMFGAINTLFTSFGFAGIIYSILLQRHQQRELTRQLRTQGWSNLHSIVEVERSLAEVPSALRFHGITEQDLQDHGVTAAELAYLVASFTAGHIYHMTHNPDASGPFPEGGYRYQMCSSEHTRRVWPLLRRFYNFSPYVQRIEDTIKVFQPGANVA